MITWLIRLIWGKRDWKLIDKEILPSPVSRILSEPSLNKMKRFQYHPDDMKQTVILTFKCSITGQVKTTVVRG